VLHDSGSPGLQVRPTYALYSSCRQKERESIDWNMVYEKQNKEWMDSDRRFCEKG